MKTCFQILCFQVYALKNPLQAGRNWGIFQAIFCAYWRHFKFIQRLAVGHAKIRISQNFISFSFLSLFDVPNFLACAVEVCVKFSIQWKVWEKLSTIKFLTGEEYDWIYFTCCTKILHDQCSVLLFIRLFTFLTNNPSLALIGRNPFRACFFLFSAFHIKSWRKHKSCTLLLLLLLLKSLFSTFFPFYRI